MSAALTPAVVPFHGDDLLAVTVDETCFIPMKPVVDALGLQWARQAKKLSWGNRYTHKYIPLQTNGGTQDMLCIPLRKVNGWLFSVNPNKVRDDVREKLVRYQEECFEVLYSYWCGDRKCPTGLVASAFDPDLQNRVWYHGHAVLASSTLALFFGCDAKTLSNLKRDPHGLFAEGTHYYDLKGDDVRRFYTAAANCAVSILPPVPPIHGLTIFTDEGARYCALSLGRQAQDAYLHLRRTYYCPEPDAWQQKRPSMMTILEQAESVIEQIRITAKAFTNVDERVRSLTA